MLAYDQAQSGGERVRVQSQVNALQLLSELHHWEPESIFTQPLRVRVQSALDRRLPQAASLQVSALPQIEAVYAQLGLARSLGASRPASISPTVCQASAEVSRRVREPAGPVLCLGNALARQSQWSRSRSPPTKKRSPLAQSSQSWDVSYQWERALGQLAQQQGQLQQAADYYRAAVQDLDLVRGNLLAIDSRAQFSLEDQVEPVYREYLQILFSSPTPDLGQAIRVNQKLQRAQLENYLRCGQLDLVALNQVQSPAQDTTKFYVIDGLQRMEVIVQPPNQQLHHYSVEREAVASAAKILQSYLQDEAFETTIPGRVFALGATSLPTADCASPALFTGWGYARFCTGLWAAIDSDGDAARWAGLFNPALQRGDHPRNPASAASEAQPVRNPNCGGEFGRTEF